MKNQWWLPVALALVVHGSLSAQEQLEVRGNFSMEGQYYRPDSSISAVVPDERMALQGFGNIIATRGQFEAGIRFETYLPSFVGYPAGAPWSGSGIGYRYAAYRAEKLEITVGNFYEQFGAGMVLRAWEDRGLGVDYALEGLRVVSRPYRGVTLKALYGKQRFNFDDGLQNGSGVVRGIDAEVNITELLDTAFTIPGTLFLGGSFVSKYERNRSSIYDFPENVGAGSVRLKYLIGGFLFSGEYARIAENPSAFNSQILPIPNELDPLVGLFQKGQGVNINTTYSRRGLGVSATVSSLANMAYQSQRNSGAFDSWINYLPATSVLNTALLAQFYPYATQPNGEVAFRGDFFYTIKKGTGLGGKYGTQVDATITRIHAPEFPVLDDLDLNRRGITPSLFQYRDQTYYADVTIKLSRKLSKKFKGSLMYMNIEYDNDVILGAYDFDDIPAKGKIFADLFVFEGNWSIKQGHSLRFETQLMLTDQHLQDWLAVVAEYTVSPHWFFSAVNQYNFGNADGNFYHFPVVALGYIKDSSRISFSYGRQRAGVFCVGGVCRVVPASNGLTVSLTTSF